MSPELYLMAEWLWCVALKPPKDKSPLPLTFPLLESAQKVLTKFWNKLRNFWQSFEGSEASNSGPLANQTAQKHFFLPVSDRKENLGLQFKHPIHPMWNNGHKMPISRESKQTRCTSYLNHPLIDAAVLIWSYTASEPRTLFYEIVFEMVVSNLPWDPLWRRKSG